MRWLAGVIVVSFAFSAHASSASSAKLRYVRAAGAEACPTADEMRAKVEAHLGAAPWSESATRLLDVQIEARERALVATIRLLDDGVPVGERTLSSQDAGCAPLADAVALALSIALDPSYLIRSLEEQDGVGGSGDDDAPSPVAAVGARTPIAPSSVGAPTRRELASPSLGPREATLQLQLEAGVAGFGTLGAAPSATGGLRLSTGARVGLLSLAIEGSGELSNRTAVPGGELSAARLTAALVPCLRLDPVGACVPLVGGGLYAEAHELIGAQRHWLPSASAGVRTFARVPLSSWLELRLSVEVLATLVRVTLQDTVTKAPLWRSAPLSLSFALELWIHP